MGLKSWYDAHIMPRLVTCACSQGQVMKRRAQVVPLARGAVFELGCGGGLNQEFYDTDAVTSFAGIDPHDGLLDEARDAARKKGWPADIRQGVGEDIPFPSGSFDSVVCTFTLCSVEDPARVLSEMRPRTRRECGEMAGPDRAGVEAAGRRLPPDASDRLGISRRRLRSRALGAGLSAQGAEICGVERVGGGAQAGGLIARPAR